MDKANKFNSEKLVNGNGTIEERISEDMGKALIIMHSSEIDPDEAIVPMIPFVLPVVGGVLIFLLAFIAVTMA